MNTEIIKSWLAYPRGRGGTRVTGPPAAPGRGLSPRARGNRTPITFDRRTGGPIPAGAGEPRRFRGASSCGGAYPRGRGGTRWSLLLFSALLGLSPRARGNRSDGAGRFDKLGPIPAGAGEPAPGAPSLRCSRAYPRGRGGTVAAEGGMVGWRGLSPRARGNHLRPRLSRHNRGPIPAGAGEPHRGCNVGGPGRAYPRGRGGTSRRRVATATGKGLSPRARGNRAAGG